MTPKERIIQAINHQETDIIPYSIELTAEARKKIVAYYGDPDFIKKLKFYYAGTGASGFPREKRINDNTFQDAFGIQWEQSEDNGFGVAKNHIFTEETFDEYEFPDPTMPELYSAIPKVIEENRERFIIAGRPSYFETAWFTYGMENLLSDMVANESFVFKLLEKIHDFNMKTIEQFLKFDIDCIHINDDYGQQNGLIMGPSLWRKYFKPYLKESVEKIKSGGKYVRLHSCGDLSEIMPDIVELGIDILNPFQPEAMDVYKIKREFGRYITFDGGVSEQKVMALGTPDDVEKETREKMEILGKGGGYIVGPSQGITRDVPVENIDRFLKIITSQRQ